jgi:N-methylhydantoinase A
METFEQVYRRLYERLATGNPVEALSWRMIVSAPRPNLPLERLSSIADGSATAGEAVKGERSIYLPEERGMRSVPVYDRYRLAPGATFAGPAVVEERESTVVLGPKAQASIDRFMTLVVDLR